MVSDGEVRRGGLSYTVETVRHFRTTVRAQAVLYLMMGTDSFTELETWKDAHEIISSCGIVVHSRGAGSEGERSPKALAALQRFGYIAKSGYYVHPSGQTLNFVATTFLPISASTIRQKLQQHQSARYLMPTDVLDYIERHAIY
jgi:nicotinate-nucleotide adenylyltransferase